MLLTGLLLCGGLPQAAHAADNGRFSTPLIGFYGGQGDSSSGPVRMARFAYLTGDVTWRADAQSDWTAGARNMPIRQGAQIWVADGSRAEVQFDDGSRVRLDSNTLITLQTLYSDSQGEFTEITLNEGEIFLRLTNQYSLYQVNTPEASIKAAGAARIRVGGGDGAQFAVRQGQATVEGANGNITLHQGDYLDVVDDNSPYNVMPLPRPDAWDVWNDQRDRRIDGYGRNHYLPSNIALVCDDLDTAGSWHQDATYGWIWAPRVTDAGWRPYSAGSWTWVEPFGWTWVGTESWGWAPYHYGTWVHASYGWAWAPGPAVQYWSPAVVSFYQSGSRVAWCPLAPREVVYPPALSIGFRSGDWSLFFSIGSAAVYYPGPHNVCVARPWDSAYVNRVKYVTNVTNVTNITVNHNTYITNNFVPSNARFQGGTQVEAQNFAGNRSAYRPVGSGDMAVFTRGRVVGAPSGGTPVAGPQAVRVTPQAFTPTRTFQPARVPQAVANRPVFRAALPANVPRAVAAPQPGQRFVSRATFNNSSAPNRPSVQPRVSSRPTGNQPGFTRPSQPANVRGDNASVSRPATSPNGTGHSAALDEYLRTRNANRGNGVNSTNNMNRNPASSNGRNQPGQANNRPMNRDNAYTPSQPQSNPRNFNRPAPSAPTPQRSTPAPQRSTPAPQDRPTRSVPAPSNTNSYRPLHNRPSGELQNNGGNNNRNTPKRQNDDRERR